MRQCDAGFITYDLVDQGPTIQNGYTISGHITIDHLGLLTTSSIQSWDYTITSLSDPAKTTYASSATGPNSSIIKGNVFATTEGIKLVTPTVYYPQEEDEILLRTDAAGNAWQYAIGTYRDPISDTYTIFDQGFVTAFSPPTPNIWAVYDRYTSPQEIAFAVASTAAVPEPSSFALLGLGGIGLAIAAYRRRLQKI